MSDEQVIDFEKAKQPHAFERPERKADAIKSKFAAARKSTEKTPKKRRAKGKRKKK